MSIKKALGAIKKVASKVATKVKKAGNKVRNTMPRTMKRLTLTASGENIFRTRMEKHKDNNTKRAVRKKK
jgi:hypothetical protein